VTLLLAATTCLRHRADLRVAEPLSSPRVTDIGSKRMLFRFALGKGGRDGSAMLSRVLAWLVEGGSATRPVDGRSKLFPGRDVDKRVSTRKPARVIEDASTAAQINKRVSPHTLRQGFATHLIEDGVDIRVIQLLPPYQVREPALLRCRRERSAPYLIRSTG
jgi:site-specific recombinase XerD